MYANLKLQLWKSGMRQNRLAKLLDMDETTLSRIVNGFREPTQEVQQNIACILECDVKWLFKTEPEEHTNTDSASVSDAADDKR
jgi:transcriptional regulator with XRE-family HTH domain